jgi:4-amino-4-deoxy-L-arabinose transferase-like glycosyltransferase
MEEPQAERRLGATAFALAACVVLALAAVLYFGGLSSYPFLDPDEGRYAEIPREMLESRDFVTPRLNYVKYFEKPPLFYWAVAGAMAALGENESAARIVPALSGLATLVLVMAVGAKVAGRRAGLLAGWVYLTSLMTLVMARLLVIDGLFSLLLAGAWCCWWFGYASQEMKSQRLWYVLAWACLGLATMAKGPVVLVLSAVLIGGFLLLRRDLRALKGMAWWPGAAIWALIVLPWHVMVSVRNPDFLRFFVVVQNFERFFGETREHVKPFWFFLPIFIVGLATWGPMAFPAFAAAARRARRAVRLTKGKMGEVEQQTDSRDAAALFLLFWVATVICFFSASSCKLVPYIWPAYPAAALLIAWYLDERGTQGRAAAWCAGAAILLLILFGLVARVMTGMQDDAPPGQLAGLVLAFQAILAAGAVAICIAIWRRSWLPVALGLAVAAVTPALIGATAKMTRYRNLATLAKALPALPAQVKVAEWRCYHQSLGFYTRRRVRLVDTRSELSLADTLGKDREFFLRGKESIQHLAQSGPLLLNIDQHKGPQLGDLAMLEPVAVNSGNLLLGNAGFFRLTGLVAWPQEAIGRTAVLLYPRFGTGRRGARQLPASGVNRPKAQR